MEYAGFWRRLGAFMIDFAALSPVIIFGSWAPSHSRLFYLYWIVPSLVFNAWFYIYLAWRRGGTPGKLALKLRIVMQDGSALSLKAAILRYMVLFILSGLTTLAAALASLHMNDATYFSFGGLDRGEELNALAPAWYQPVRVALQLWLLGGLISLLFTKKSRAIHEFIAGTVVIKNAPGPYQARRGYAEHTSE